MPWALRIAVTQAQLETDVDRESETSTNSHADQDLENWLGGRDSNPDNVVQSHVSYR
jgi:hypothetical protein